MNRKLCKKINTERLAGWQQKLSEAGATARILIGLDGANPDPRAVLLVCEDTADTEIVVILGSVLEMLLGGTARPFLAEDGKPAVEYTASEDEPPHERN